MAACFRPIIRLFGIGKKIATDICTDASVDLSKRVTELNDEELNKIRDIIDNKYSIESLQKQVDEVYSSILSLLG